MATNAEYFRIFFTKNNTICYFKNGNNCKYNNNKLKK